MAAKDKRVVVTHFMRREWWVTTRGWAPLAGPYANGRSARYVAKLLNEVLDKEPCAECG